MKSATLAREIALPFGRFLSAPIRYFWVNGPLAVLTHDLADGVNTVSLCLTAKARDAARVWLVLNGAAPMLGVLAGLSVIIAAAALAPLLATFAGIFLYIGACELLPRSYALDPRLRTTVASLAGMALMFVVTSIAH